MNVVKDFKNIIRLCLLFLLIIFNIYEYSIEYNFIYLTFNVILDNTFLIFHPPLILISIIFIKYQMFIELFNKHLVFNKNSYNYTYLFIFTILTIGIVTGSLWSSYLF